MMRQRVQKYSQYQILKLFNFVDLMFMAQFYQEKTFGYKQYLYKEGCSPEQIYLIEQGEFQFTKLFEDNQQSERRSKLKQKIARKRNMSKQKRLAIDFQDMAVYNIVKPARMKQYRVGTVVGGIGQSIGEQQIILNKSKRIYNAKCMSTTNRVIVIKKQHILRILNSNSKLLIQLRNQLSQKQRVINKAHKKLQQIRMNMQNFVKLVQLQSDNGNSQLINYNPSKLTHRFESHFKLPSLQRKNLTQMKRKKQSLSNFNNTNKDKLNHSMRMSNDSLLINKSKLQSSQHNNHLLYQDNYNQNHLHNHTFALTSFDQHHTHSIKTNHLQQNIKLPKQHQSQQLLQQSKLDHFITLKASKSWNMKPISPQKIINKQKYIGMIDSSTLVKEKQHILEIKRNPNNTDQRTQFQQRHKLIYKQNQIEKQKSPKATTAHSKQYMQKMLLNALEKAGYQQSMPQIHASIRRGPQPTMVTQPQGNAGTIQDEDPFGAYSQSRNLKGQKLMMKMKKKKRGFFESVNQVLQSNPFDECYFGKLN